MNDPDDEELSRLLRASGRAGERRAPAFQRVWHAAKAASAARRAAPQTRLAWAAAVAAAIALCAVVALPRRPAPVVITEAPAASDEALPTDFLLTTNNDEAVHRLTGEIDALLRP